MAATLGSLRLASHSQPQSQMPPPQSPSSSSLQPCQVQLLFVQGGPSPTPCAPGPYLAKCSIRFVSADGRYVALLNRDQGCFGSRGRILEGRKLSLIHPLVMGSLFMYTLWAGYLGWHWRRVRTLQEEINDLKKQVKPAAVTPGGSPPPELPPPSPAKLKIQQLTEERKELIKGSFRDRHFNAGSILLGFGCWNRWEVASTPDSGQASCSRVPIC